MESSEEAGVKINAVAGTSVGALDGALICMDDVENAVRTGVSDIFQSDGCGRCVDDPAV